MLIALYVTAALIAGELVRRLARHVFSRQHAVPAGYRSVPGPRGWPIVGNTYQLNARPQRQLREWAQQYGELFRLRMGFQDWVFINSFAPPPPWKVGVHRGRIDSGACSPDAVKDILDRQSAATSSRLPSPVISDLLSGGLRMLLMPYCERWRKLRGLVHRLLSLRMSNKLAASLEFEAKQLLYDCLTDNDGPGGGDTFYQHVRRLTVSVVMTTTYGRRVPKWVSHPVPHCNSRWCSSLLQNPSRTSPY